MDISNNITPDPSETKQRRPEQTNRVMASGITLTIITVVLMAVVGEIILRLWDYPAPISSGWGWDGSPRRKVSAATDITRNQLGLRGLPISYDTDDTVVILLGDSQVEAATGPLKDMPERLLEEHLGSALPSHASKVFSLASSGWGTDQQLLALERYFQKYRADLVLVWLTPENDLWENGFPDRSMTKKAGRLKPTFWFDGTTLQGPFFHGDIQLSPSRLWELVLRAVNRVKHGSSEQYILDKWIQKLPSDIRPLATATTGFCESLPVLDQQAFIRNIFSLPESGVVMRTKEDVIGSRSHFAPFVEPASPRDKYLIDLTRLLLARVKEVSKQHRATFKAIYPLRHDFDELGRRGLRCVETEGGMRLPIKMDSLDLAKRIVDVDDLLVFNVPGGEEISVNQGDRHFSRVGNDRAMQALADELVRRGLLPLGPRRRGS